MNPNEQERSADIPERNPSVLVSDQPGEESERGGSGDSLRGEWTAAPDSSGGGRGQGRLKRWTRWIIAVLASQSIGGSILLLGWISSRMRHVQGRFWAREAGEGGWERLTRQLPEWHALQEGASWLSNPASLGGWWSRSFGRLRLLAGLGLAQWAGTCILTLPGLALMYFSWYAGWQNSFNKGYEDAWVGPATGLGGIALWILAMLYVPMAQARLACAGEWRSFFDFKLVLQLIRRAWLGNVFLAAGYAVLSLPWIVAWLAPGGLPQIHPEWGQASPEQVARILGRIQLGAAIVLVPAWVGLKWFAARLYATALLDGVQKGGIAEGQLARLEWHTLNTLGLLQPAGVAALRGWQRALLRVGTGVGRVMAGGAAVLLWFVVIGEVYIAQFFVYRGGWGWLNHPFIQLPWLNL